MDVDLESSQTLDLLKSAAAILNETNFDFDNEIMDVIDEGQFFMETSTPNDDLLFNQDYNNVLNKNQYEMNKTHSIHNSNKSLDLCAFENEEALSFAEDEFVCINKKKFGRVKYVGCVHFADGIFCGIELEEPDGKHDGKIDEKRYVHF